MDHLGSTRPLVRTEESRSLYILYEAEWVRITYLVFRKHKRERTEKPKVTWLWDLHCADLAWHARCSQLGELLVTSAMTRAVSWARRNALPRTSTFRFQNHFSLPFGSRENLETWQIRTEYKYPFVRQLCSIYDFTFSWA